MTHSPSRQVSRRLARQNNKRSIINGKMSASVDKQTKTWLKENKRKFFRLQGAWLTDHNHGRVPVTVVRGVYRHGNSKPIVLVETETGARLKVYTEELDISDTYLKSWSDEYDDIVAEGRRERSDGNST